MARIGLNNFRFGILTEAQDGTATYSAAQKPAKAVSCNVSITNNDASLYADDGLAESDRSFQSGTVTMGIDNDDLATMATLLGHTFDSATGKITRNSNDAAPYVGLGRIITRMLNGVYNYKVEFLKKVKFSEPSQEDTTKGDSVEFGTTEIEGTIATLANGDWSDAEVFDSKDDALAYLESLFGTTPTSYTVTYNANGGTGSVDPETVVAGGTITLDDGAGLTPPANKVFAGWAKTPTATAATVTSPYRPADDTTLYAVWTNAE